MMLRSKTIVTNIPSLYSVLTDCFSKVDVKCKSVSSDFNGLSIYATTKKVLRKDIIIFTSFKFCLDTVIMWKHFSPSPFIWFHQRNPLFLTVALQKDLCNEQHYKTMTTMTIFAQIGGLSSEQLKVSSCNLVPCLCNNITDLFS